MNSIKEMKKLEHKLDKWSKSESNKKEGKEELYKNRLAAI